MKFTNEIFCFCVLVLCVEVYGGNLQECCPPGLAVSLLKVKGQAVCFSPWKNDSKYEMCNLQCEDGYLSRPYNFYTHHEDGSFSIDYGEYGIHNHSEDSKYSHCLGHMYNRKKNITLDYGVFCVYKEGNRLGYTFIVSVIFLLITVFIYSVCEDLRDLLGLSYINLCGSLAVFLALFASILLMIDDGSNQPLCAERGFLAYFFMLASFFWTTAISIQLLLSVRSGIFVWSNKWKLFGWYALFAWGSALVITVAMAIVNFHPGDHAKPGIGLESCWFQNGQNYYWLYSILGVVTSANIIMFVYMSYIIWCNKFASSPVKAMRHKLCTTMQLFFVMGLFWILELIGAANTSNTKANYWFVINIITALQGLWIFLVIVVFNRRVVRTLHQRGWLPCISRPLVKYLVNDDAEDQVTMRSTVAAHDKS